MPGQGTCLCGKSGFSFEGEAAAQLACHCLPCRKMSGTATSHNILVPEDKFKSHGELRTFVRPGDSGKNVIYRYCAECPTINHATIESIPGMILMKLGTIDTPELFDNYYPQQELYTKNRPGWAKEFDQAKQAETS